MTETKTKYLVVGETDTEIQTMEQRLTHWPEQMSGQERYQLATVAVAYGLDPLMGDLTMYQGKPYVTIGGLRRLAQRQGLDGSEVYPLTPEERELHDIPEGEYAYKAIVWKRGSSHPYIDYGRAGAENVSLKTRAGGDMPIAKWMRELAMKRAEARALRKAFSVGMVGRDEVDERDDFSQQRQVTVIEPPRKALPAAPAKPFEELPLEDKIEALRKAYATPYMAGKSSFQGMSPLQLKTIGGSALGDLNKALEEMHQPTVEHFADLQDEGLVAYLWQLAPAGGGGVVEAEAEATTA